MANLQTFVRLTCAKTGGPVLIPEDATVLSIIPDGTAPPVTDDRESDPGAFWLEYIVHPSQRTMEVPKKAVHVRGPLDSILEALGADASISESSLEAELEEARAEARDAAWRAQQATEQMERVLLESDAAHELLRSVDWDSPSLDFHTAPLWSTFRFDPATEGLGLDRYWRLFMAARGSAGQGFKEALGLALTNMREGGRMPFGVVTRVHGVVVEFLRGEPEDIEVFKNQGVLSWDFTQTMVEIGALGSFQWTDERRGFLKLGDPSSQDPPEEADRLLEQSNLFRLGRVMTIPGNTTFAVCLHLDKPRGVKKPVVLRVTLACDRESTIELG